MDIGEEVIDFKYRTMQIWWDPIQEHFVALVDLIERGNDEASAVFQIFSSGKRDESPRPVHKITIDLPSSLLRDSLSKKYPVLVRISLDHKLLCIQFSDTMLRVAPIIPDGLSDLESGDVNDKQWALDFAIDCSPVPISPTSMKSKSFNLGLLNKPSGNVLDGGVIWSNHGGTSQDFVVVTTRAVLCYKVSLQRKQMALSHTLHHPFQHPTATATWFEPKTRCLVVLSKWPSSKVSHCVKVYVLSSNSAQNQEQRHKPSPFPRLELPPPEKFPSFMLDTLKKGDGKRNLYLVNLEGYPYFVDLVVGDNTSLKLYQLNTRELFHHVSNIAIHDALPVKHPTEAISASVLDNILCFSTSTHVLLLDIINGFYFVLPSIMKAPSKSKLEFLGHQYLLVKQQSYNNTGYFFHRLRLNLGHVGGMVQEASSRIPFLLRRRAPYDIKARSLVLAELNMLIERQTGFLAHPDSAYKLAAAEACRIWIRQVVGFYKEEAFELDCRNSAPLITKCALLSSSAEKNNASNDAIKKDSKIPFLLSQTEILGEALLVQANDALKEENNIKLGVVREVTAAMISALTNLSFQICPALYCLMVALLWRRGHDKEVITVINSISDYMMDDISGRDKLAEMTLRIAEEIPFGCQTCDLEQNSSNYDKGQKLSDRLLQCVSTFASPQMVARTLLQRGQLKESISLLIRSTKTNGEQEYYESISKQDSVPKDGLKGTDFFAVALSIAVNEKSVADRCRLFNYLHRFLRMWDPASLSCELPEEGIEAAESLETVSKQFDIFPDELFGGAGSPSSQRVRELFGY
mmetsp:Transcript_33009/g.49868  ORF Transcript_33009/g.49868 Transcript_33009/m.49868 type:complete len:804 (+) Transcript_33009:125-2536(+)